MGILRPGGVTIKNALIILVSISTTSPNPSVLNTA